MSCASCGGPHSPWATDRLTLLLDRWGWDEQAAELLDGAALLVVDLDNFKRVNDRYGHPAGDAVLKAVADTLRATTRKGDLLGRYGGHGGDEFLVLLPGTSLSEAMGVAERIRVGVRGMRVFAGERTLSGISVSIGVAAGLLDLAALIAAADESLRSAKRSGRDRVGSGSWSRRRGVLAVVGAAAAAGLAIVAFTGEPRVTQEAAQAAAVAGPQPVLQPPAPSVQAPVASTVTVSRTVTALVPVPPPARPRTVQRTRTVPASPPASSPPASSPSAQPRELDAPQATRRRACVACEMLTTLMRNLEGRWPR
ncbi:GGDEF domain-containing protein [Actinocrispum sp. NPDC049592]|uniref:GGDEF domain-containing protein n=1 Tax=Actinocrispum sp. NPDC049592 TaxID=3154835 RepID=UPI003417A947